MKFSSKWRSAFFALCLALSFSSCLDIKDSVYDRQSAADDQKISKYLSDNHIEATKHFMGFYYQVLTANETGAALVQNDVVDFKYKISLLDGTLLEDSMLAKKPAKLKLLNYSIVPQALDQGISLMKVGSKYRFYIPSNLAFGNYQSSGFPSNSILIADVQVLKKQSETDVEVAQLDSIDHFMNAKYANFQKFASGLYYADSIVGTGNKPHLGDRVTINMTRRYLDGTLIRSISGLSLVLGTGQAVQGLEEGIMQMRQGGKAVLIMPASIAFKQSLCLLPQKVRAELLEDQLITSEVLPYSIVEYVIELTGN